MLIALFTYLLLSSDVPGTLVKTLETYVQEEIHDTKRQQVILADLDEIKQTLVKFTDITSDTTKTLNSVKGSREEVKKSLARFHDERAVELQHVLDVRYKIKGEMSREEWDSAFKAYQ